MSSLLDMLAIAMRGDVRSDVLKELERHLAKLNEYQNHPGIDGTRLRALMSNLIRLRSDLSSAGAAWLQPLRDSEFLAAIKHRSSIPGGTCEFDLPDYFHWLNLPAETRQANFNAWLATLRPLCESVADLLWITRENARPRREVATQGIYQIVFERELPIQLLRITLPGDSPLFPEISGSHHRCSIRFMSWTDAESRPLQAPGDVPFVLTLCT